MWPRIFDARHKEWSLFTKAQRRNCFEEKEEALPCHLTVLLDVHNVKLLRSATTIAAQKTTGRYEAENGTALWGEKKVKEGEGEILHRWSSAKD